MASEEVILLVFLWVAVITCKFMYSLNRDKNAAHVLGLSCWRFGMSFKAGALSRICILCALVLLDGL